LSGFQELLYRGLPYQPLNAATLSSVRNLESPRSKMIFERIAVGTAAISWWILCEYLRARIPKSEPSKFLGFAGFAGASALILIAVLF
jgi:hypothetical protein